MRQLSLPHTSWVTAFHPFDQHWQGDRVIPEVCPFGIYNRIIPLQLINGSFSEGTEKSLWELSHFPSPHVQCKDRHRQVLFCPYTQARYHRINISCGSFSTTRSLGLWIPFSNRKKSMPLLLILHVASAKKHMITQCKAWRKISA